MGKGLAVVEKKEGRKGVAEYTVIDLHIVILSFVFATMFFDLC